MKKHIKMFGLGVIFLLSVQNVLGQRIQIIQNKKVENPYYSRTDTRILNIKNADWKKVLNPDLYAVLRENNTEKAFSGQYNNFTGIGTYYCAACGNVLFRSDAKFSSTCGWPSFFETIRDDAVIYKQDNSYNMQRTEVSCGRCDGHLGHVFDDGPPPTMKRFCMNSISLEFEPDKKSKKIKSEF